MLVTADHGMNDDRSHGGILPEERQVPLYVFGDSFSLQPDAAPQQTELCGTVCQLLGVTCDKSVSRDLLVKGITEGGREDSMAGGAGSAAVLAVFIAFQIAPLVWMAINSFTATWTAPGGWRITATC